MTKMKRILLDFDSLPIDECKDRLKIGSYYLMAHPKTGKLRVCLFDESKRKFFGYYPKFFSFKGRGASEGYEIFLDKVTPEELITGAFCGYKDAIEYRNKVSK